jgi:small subunit ribosomal protein S16
MVKIRLKRTGAKNSPAYRVVVADERSPRDGKFIEEIGSYWPLRKDESNFHLNVERANYWIGVGAQPSETVKSILRKIKRTEAAGTPPVAAA